MELPGVDLAATEPYRSRLADRLDADDDSGGRSDGAVGAVFEEWCAHVRRHSGAVLADPGDARDGSTDPHCAGDPDWDPEPGRDGAPGGSGGGDAVAPRDLFLDALTFDAAVRALRAAVETACGLTVETPDDALDLAPVHDAVGVSLVDDGGATPATGGASGAGLDLDPDAFDAVGADDLRRLYERTVPARSRRVFGEYYTPPGLAELGVEAALSRVAEPATAVVVDPGCGAGAFLTAALRHKRATDRRTAESATETVERLTGTVVGVDVNPVAVGAARASYLLALAPLAGAADGDRLRIPVALGDALGLAGDPPATDVVGGADALVGNPPWITWDRLPAARKRRLRDGPIDRLDLFDRSGATARLGHANDDLSLPFVWTCLDRYLRDGGVAAFVMKRDHVRGPAGRLLRSGRVGPRPLAVEAVHDVAAVDPFEGVDAAAALYLFRVGREEGAASRPGRGDGDTEPVPLTVWTPASDAGEGDGEGVSPTVDSLAAFRETTRRTQTELVPVDPEDPAGPWHRADADVDALGECDYRIRHGLKDDAKAVFSVDDELVERIEPTHVFPYLRSKHVVKWGLFGHDRFLVPQRRAGEDNADALAESAPATYAYLEAHRERLRDRGSSWFDDGPFYSLFGLGPYTWAPYKVVWCRLGFKPHFTVVSTVDDDELGRKPVVPGDHCMFVACEGAHEAHYLCALLNSAPYQRCLRDVAGSGKASLSKSVVSSLSLPRWEAAPRQRRLAALSRRAHEVVPDYVDRSKRAYNRLSIPELTAVERDIDAVVTDLLHD